MKLAGYFSGRKWIFWAGGAVLFALLVWGVISLVRYLKEPVICPDRAIPADVAWVLVINEGPQLWEKLSEGNDLLDGLCRFDFFSDLHTRLIAADSLLKKEPSARELLSGQSIFICCRYPEKKGAEYLFLFSLPDAHHEKEINAFFSGAFPSCKSDLIKDTLGFSIHMINCPHDGVLYYVHHRGILLLSYSEAFLEDALFSIESPRTLSLDAEFIKMKAAAGKRVDANLYINIHRSGKAFAKFLHPDLVEAKRLIPSFSGWTGLDLIIKKDEWTFSGYTMPEKKDYLSVFLEDKAQKIEMPNALPFNTSMMLFVGSENFETLHQRLLKFRAESGGRGDTVDQYVRKHFQCGLNETVFPWIGHEAALVMTESRRPGDPDHIFGVFSIRDKAALRDALKRFSIEEEREIYSDPSNEGNDQGHLNIPGLFPSLFGPAFSKLKGNYYVVLDDYLLVGNSIRALNRFQKAREAGKTLSQNENYQAFSENFADKASLCLYVNLRKLAAWLPDWMDPEMAGKLEKQMDPLRNFQAFALQFAPENEALYTNMYLRYNSDGNGADVAVWEATLDTTLIFETEVVRDKDSKAIGFVACDAQYKVYYIDLNGEIRWTYQSDAPILGKPQAIGKGEKKAPCIVFNTRTRLLMLDENGKLMPGFPHRLAFTASNPVCVADYDGNGDLRLLVVGDDHKLYNFNAQAGSVSGWKPPDLTENVELPIVHQKWSGGDVLIATDVKGHCHFYNRQGKAAFQPPETEFVKSRNGRFYHCLNGKESCLLTTSRKGRIIRIPPDGNFESIDLRPFSPDHYFCYQDFNGDGAADYIFADSNFIIVFDKNKDVLFELELGGSVCSDIVPLPATGEQAVFAVLYGSDGQMAVFSKNGLSTTAGNITGKGSFATELFDNEEFTAIILSSESTLRYFLLTDKY